MVEVNVEQKPDMTPMIDCVFQLIIFFVLVIDLTQKDLESLKLPKAKFAVPDDAPPDIRPVLNITQDGTMIYQGHPYYTPQDPENFEGVTKLLSLFANDMMTKAPLSPGSSMMLPDDPLLIRADIWTDFHFVAKLMEQCGKQGIQIWKLELALAEPDYKDRK
jgi:biopolymer transport protein ExbD